MEQNLYAIKEFLSKTYTFEEALLLRNVFGKTPAKVCFTREEVEKGIDSADLDAVRRIRWTGHKSVQSYRRDLASAPGDTAGAGFGDWLDDSSAECVLVKEKTNNIAGALHRFNAACECPKTIEKFVFWTHLNATDPMIKNQNGGIKLTASDKNALTHHIIIDEKKCKASDASIHAAIKLAYSGWKGQMISPSKFTQDNKLFEAAVRQYLPHWYTIGEARTERPKRASGALGSYAPFNAATLFVAEKIGQPLLKELVTLCEEEDFRKYRGSPIYDIFQAYREEEKYRSRDDIAWKLFISHLRSLVVWYEEEPSAKAWSDEKVLSYWRSK